MSDDRAMPLKPAAPPRLRAIEPSRTGVIRRAIGLTQDSSPAVPEASQAPTQRVIAASDPAVEVVQDDIHAITDWYIPEGNEHLTRVYPGARPVSGALLEHARAIGQLVAKRREGGAFIRDYRLEYQGLLLRGHIQETVEGVMHMLRRVARELPSIHVLGLPKEVKRALIDPRFGSKGGLILFTGGPGNGKSTTASALVTERVLVSGAFCICVEDPPEFMLQGDHPAAGGRIGKIIQVPAVGGAFSECLRDALRCYPSNSRGAMLLIGEIRDAQTAAQALRAAVNGQLVISTLHASDPIAALERILSMSAEHLGADEARTLLAHSLRAVIQQSLDHGALSAQCLFSTKPQSSVAASISAGQMRLLSTELEQQQIFIERGMLLQRLELAAPVTPA